MIKIPVTLVVLFISLQSFSQKGSTFPYLEGENLIHGMINLPENVKGKHTLVGLAFSKKSESHLKSWFNPVYQQLIKEPDPNTLFAFSYDINVYFVPMLTGAKRPAYEKVMQKVQKDVDKQLHPHILFFKGTLKQYKETLNIQEKDVPYFYLLDEQGKIIYATKGVYTEAKLQKIINQLPFE